MVPSITTQADRKRMNFMIDVKLVKELEEVIPSGERSNFINEALTEAITQLSRQKAIEGLKKIRENNKVKLSNKEILELINYGRK